MNVVVKDEEGDEFEIKKICQIPATVKYLEDKPQINWEGTNLAAHV
jgi:hypothetical protein